MPHHCRFRVFIFRCLTCCLFNNYNASLTCYVCLITTLNMIFSVMVFNITMVTCRMTLLMNEWTNTAMDGG